MELIPRWTGDNHSNLFTLASAVPEGGRMAPRDLSLFKSPWAAKAVEETRKSNFNASYFISLSHTQIYTCSAAAIREALLQSISFSLLLFVLLCLICWNLRKGVRHYASFCIYEALLHKCCENSNRFCTIFALFTVMCALSSQNNSTCIFSILLHLVCCLLGMEAAGFVGSVHDLCDCGILSRHTKRIIV